jgi:hypothetical protein
MTRSKSTPNKPGPGPGPAPAPISDGGSGAARKRKRIAVFFPLAGILMALGAMVFSRLENFPLPENTWAMLISCAGILAANVYLTKAIDAALEEARRRGEDSKHAVVGKTVLFGGLVSAAALIEALYVRSADRANPYGDVLAGTVMVGMGVFGIWFMLTRHETLWDACRRIKSGDVPLPSVLRHPRALYPLMSVYELYHWKPSRIFFIGIGFPFLILAGARALWMNPVFVLERAQGGDARWQYEAGQLYVTGDGLPRDRDKAFALYLAAARQGYYKAYYHVGRMYSLGQGTARDPAEAARWLRKAVEEGDPEPEAWNLLGLAYGDGEGVEQDPVWAAKCFRRAAEGGSANGQANLGVVYELGFGLAADQSLALYWYGQAAGEGHPAARERVEALEAQGVRPRKPDSLIGAEEESR